MNETANKICRIAICHVLMSLSFLGCSQESNSSNMRPTDSGTESNADTETQVQPLPTLDDFYNPATVQTIELDIEEADLQVLSEALPDRIYVPARFQWNGIKKTNVGVRYKGNSSSSPMAVHKRSFLIKFNEYEKGERFLGVRRLALDNGIQFGSLFSERLITDILRDLEVTSMRSNYCRLFINGEYMGVYVNVERVDSSFLENHFERTDGPFFKCDEGGPGSDLTFLGDDASSYSTTFESKNSENNQAQADLEDLISFVKELNQVTSDDSVSFLEQNLELDEFIRLMAVMLYAGAFDQLTGWNPHNYYLYQNPSTNRWVYIAWDLDVGFSDNAFDTIPVLDGWNAAYPYPVVMRPLLRLIVENDELLQKYRQSASQILDTYFDPNVLVPKLNGLHEQIKPHLVDDPFPHIRVTNPFDRDYESIVESLTEFIHQRYERATEELANPRVTAPAEPINTQPEPGDPSADAPSVLHVTKQSSSQISLGWTDNAVDEAGFIVQRCEGVNCTDFFNHMGFPIPDLEEAADNAVISGTTYRYRVYAIKPSPGGSKATGTSNVVQAQAIE